MQATPRDATFPLVDPQSAFEAGAQPIWLSCIRIDPAVKQAFGNSMFNSSIIKVLVFGPPVSIEQLNACTMRREIHGAIRVSIYAHTPAQGIGLLWVVGVCDGGCSER